ncbi:unnamed protein product [Chondrus crispus]|uniref:DUF155 domain-containing protein n=1 Tax=Chondrus crispus TaxID=2769 RepID=R7QH32_CHOCR|nr:unnamed protein product [Chondrus crispus]CDF37043.1 unnamed protein product [Chondrus crispus]|eukprot:XP_005716862.1 unnamed protein product [Chondrus crispus]
MSLHCIRRALPAGIQASPHALIHQSSHHGSIPHLTRSLTSHRPIAASLGRKTRHRRIQDGDGVCAAYCVSAPVSLTAVSNHFKSRNFSIHLEKENLLFKSTGFNLYSGDVAHLPLQSVGTSAYHGHAFFFSSGAAVFWGLPISVRRQLLDSLANFQDRSTPPILHSLRTKHTLPLAMEQFDHEFNYIVDGTRKTATFKNDAIQLSSFSDATQLVALSYGLAQSVKLLLFEEEIDNLVKRTRTLPDELARDGKIQLSQRDLKRLIGELLAARYSVNLVSDIMDTPEFFWKHAELEGLHVECAREVELRQRARILNTRTQVIKDALDILNNELSSSSSDRVERAILFLIAVEVVLELGRLVPSAVQMFR